MMARCRINYVAFIHALFSSIAVVVVVVERSTILYMAASDMQQGFNGPFIPAPSRYMF